MQDEESQSMERRIRGVCAYLARNDEFIAALDSFTSLSNFCDAVWPVVWRAIGPLDVFSPPSDHHEYHDEKSSIKALSYKDKGNKAWVRKQIAMAVTQWTEALHWCPQDETVTVSNVSVPLRAVLLCNRCAGFVEMHDDRAYNDAINAYELAPQYKRASERLALCSEPTHSLSQYDTHDGIDVRVTEERGREYYAIHDICSETVVLAEKAVVCVAKGNVCSLCASRYCLPCATCTSVCVCSDCHGKHQNECGHVGWINRVGYWFDHCGCGGGNLSLLSMRVGECGEMECKRRDVYSMACACALIGTLNSDKFCDVLSTYLSLQLNSFKDGDTIAYYKKASLFNHSCVPNAVALMKHGHMSVVLERDVNKDEGIFISYGPRVGMMGEKRRKKMLQDVYLFNCCCVGCFDTENGNVICDKCGQNSGIEYPDDTVYVCGRCHADLHHICHALTTPSISSYKKYLLQPSYHLAMLYLSLDDELSGVELLRQLWHVDEHAIVREL